MSHSASFDDALVGADEAVLERLGQEPHLTSAIRQLKSKSPLSGSWCRKSLDQSRTGQDICHQDASWRLCHGWLLKQIAKVYKTALSPMRIFTKIMQKMEKSKQKAFRSSQKDFVSIKNTAAYLAQVKSENCWLTWRATTLSWLPASRAVKLIALCLTGRLIWLWANLLQ